MALRTMCGRKVILTDVQTIDETNVVSVLRKALVTHLSNKMDIEYLWKYYKGRQPILDREKDVRYLRKIHLPCAEDPSLWRDLRHVKL